MVRYKGDYGKESFCSRCEQWIPEPTYRIMDLAIGIAPNPDIDKHPEIKIGKVWHDKKGWKHTILARFVLLHPKWTTPVYCSKGHMCRGGPLSKIKKSKEYIPSNNPVGRPKGSKNQTTRFEESINDWWDMRFKDRDMLSMLQQYNDRGFRYADKILDVYEGREGLFPANTPFDWLLDLMTKSSVDILEWRKVVVKKLKEYAKKHKLEIKNENKTSKVS